VILTLFLAHLSTECSWWAIVTGLCLSSVVVRRAYFFLLKHLLLWNHSLDFDQTSQDHNAIFKNLLVFNYQAQSFHIGYIASSRGPRPKLLKLCPLGQYWPCPGGHNLTLNYIRKSLNDIFSWTAYGNLIKLDRNGPWVVLYKNCSNGSDWLHK